MDVKEAIAAAKNYVNDIYAEEQVSNLGLEEIEYDENNKRWATLQQLIEGTTEIAIPSLHGFQREEFDQFGLTDGVILHLCDVSSSKISCTILTADGPLAHQAMALGYDVLFYPDLLA